MGNKLSRGKSVDSKFTKPTGLYPTCDWDEKTVKKLINKKKVAPRYPGREEPGPDLDECPICFLWYPGGLNRSKCCKKPICTECFLQFKKPNAQKAIQCPFCNSLNYSVKYTGQMTKEEREALEAEEQKVIEAKIRARKAELSRQIEREKEVALEREQKKQEAAAAGPTQPPPPPESHDSNPVNQSARESESGSRRWRPSANSEVNDDEEHDRANTDIEELMVMEAIRLSLLDIKNGDYADQGTENASDEDSNTYENAQSILAAGMDASSSDDEGCFLAGPTQRAALYEDDESYGGGNGGYHSDRTLDKRVIARRLHSERNMAAAEGGFRSSQDDLALESRLRYRSFDQRHTSGRAHVHSHIHSEFEQLTRDDLDDVEAKQEIANLLEMNLEWFAEESTLRRYCPWDYEERSISESEEAGSPNPRPSVDRMNPSMSPVALEPLSTVSPPAFGTSPADAIQREGQMESDLAHMIHAPRELDGQFANGPTHDRSRGGAVDEFVSFQAEDDARMGIHQQESTPLDKDSATHESSTLIEGAIQGEQASAELSSNSNLDAISQEPCPSPQLVGFQVSGGDRAAREPVSGGETIRREESSPTSEELPTQPEQRRESAVPDCQIESPSSNAWVEGECQIAQTQGTECDMRDGEEVLDDDRGDNGQSTDELDKDTQGSQEIEESDGQVQDQGGNEELVQDHDTQKLELEPSSDQGEELKSSGEDTQEGLSNDKSMACDAPEEQLHGEDDETSSKKILAVPTEELGCEELR
uniref:RING-type domain-containing protein n=1 Tax=Guillardia theta TaxID=55529 RepID=A0A7S4JDB5_GUITH|mmetsp:Transcript_15431/g.51781  ORF Transcript_15431/g.51781 Transcript_15431/m.51781 type:complete len:762 (+) Transcript_15431:13-2298(+)